MVFSNGTEAKKKKTQTQFPVWTYCGRTISGILTLSHHNCLWHWLDVHDDCKEAAAAADCSNWLVWSAISQLFRPWSANFIKLATAASIHLLSQVTASFYFFCLSVFSWVFLLLKPVCKHRLWEFCRTDGQKFSWWPSHCLKLGKKIKNHVNGKYFLEICRTKKMLQVLM